MSAHQITGIRKPDRYSAHEGITHVRYDGYIWTRRHVVNLITAGTDSFYVVGGGYKIPVRVVRPGGMREPYLETLPDRTKKDNLLSLPEV